jgi:hypothetical protein
MECYYTLDKTLDLLPGGEGEGAVSSFTRNIKIFLQTKTIAVRGVMRVSQNIESWRKKELFFLNDVEFITLVFS